MKRIIENQPIFSIKNFYSFKNKKQFVKDILKQREHFFKLRKDALQYNFLLAESKNTEILYNSFLKVAKKHLVALKKNFLASEDSDSLTKRNHLSELVNTCLKADEAVDGLFQNIKKRFKSTALQYCDQPNIIEITIVMTDHNKEKHKEYKKLYDKYDLLFNDWAIGNFLSQRGVLESVAKEIRKLRTEFAENYPDFAKQFLEDAKGKAVPLGSITEELLTWLRENDLIDKYSVTKR